MSGGANGGFFRSRWIEPPTGIEELEPTTLAPGFRGAGVACGLKPSGAPTSASSPAMLRRCARLCC